MSLNYVHKRKPHGRLMKQIKEYNICEKYTNICKKVRRREKVKLHDLESLLSTPLTTFATMSNVN